MIGGGTSSVVEEDVVDSSFSGFWLNDNWIIKFTQI